MHLCYSLSKGFFAYIEKNALFFPAELEHPFPQKSPAFSKDKWPLFVASFPSTFYPKIARLSTGEEKVVLCVRGAGGGPIQSKAKVGPDLRALLQEEVVEGSQPLVPQNTAELAQALKRIDKSGLQFLRFKQHALGIIEKFAQTKIKTEDLIEEVSLLVAADDAEITKHLMGQFIQAIHDSVLLQPPLLEGLAEIVQNANPAHLNPDDLIRVMQVIFQQIKKTYEAKVTQDRLVVELLGLCEVLNAMVDTNVSGLNRVNVHEPTYDILQTLSEESDLTIALYASYAKQALVRIPNEETKLALVMRKGLSLGKGLMSLNRAFQEKSPAELYQAYLHFRDLIKHQEGKEEWYEELRIVQFFLLGENLKDLKLFLQQLDSQEGHLHFTRHPYFAYELVLWLDRYIRFSKKLEENGKEVFSLLREIYTEEDKWGPLPSLFSFRQNKEEPRAKIKGTIEEIFSRAETTWGIALPSSSKSSSEKAGDKKLYLSPIVNHSSRAASPLFDLVQKEQFPLEVSLQRCKKALFEDDFFKEESAFYVPVNAGEEQQCRKVVDLEQEVSSFLQGPAKVLLLLGDSGLGKSMFCEYLAHQLWKKYHKESLVPLFINLPRVKDPIRGILSEFQEKYHMDQGQLEELQNSRDTLFILDGYDETRLLQNLYQTNELGKWKRAKVVISCRTTYLIQHPNYKEYFEPASNSREQSLLQIRYVAPFSSDQIHSYLKKYIEKGDTEWKKWELYREEIQRIPHLQELIQNPFILKIVARVLPEIVTKHRNENPDKQLKLTRLQLYEAFVWDWFEREKQKLKSAGMLPTWDVKKDFEKFSRDLAQAMYKKEITCVEYKEEDEGFDGEEIPNEWSKFFTTKKPRVAIARRGCPLRKVGENQYAFIHQTVMDFFVSQAVFEG